MKKFILSLAVLALCLIPAGALAFEGGKGTESDPYLIATEEDLNQIYYMPNMCYKLVNNIELTGEFNNPTNFTGVLDGNGYEISNLSRVKWSYNGSSGFICRNEGTIKNLIVRTAEGYTIGSESSGLDYVGILVGHNYNGTIENCGVHGELTSNANYVGGLVGRNYANIRNSYSIADITATSGTAGGLIGNIASGYYPVYCYSVGTVTAAETAYSLAPSAGASYYDVTVCGFSNGGGSRKVTYAMKQQNTYEDWDFESTWGISPEINDGYPYLQINRAAQESMPNLVLSSAYGVTGNTVELYLSVENNPGIASFVTNIEYDPAILYPTAVENGSLFASEEIYTNVDGETDPQGKVFFSFVNPSNMSEDGVILKITFDVLTTAPLGDSIVNVTVDSMVNQDYKDLQFTVQDGVVTVSDVLMGDVNLDSEVDVRDLLMLMKYLARQTTIDDKGLKAADVYPDGEIDSKDSLRLAQYLAGWENISLGIL